MSFRIIILLVVIIFSGCEKQSDWILSIPSFGEHSVLTNSEPISGALKDSIEGIYAVELGKKLIGDTVVIKRIKSKFSFFFSKNGGYIISDAGWVGTEIIMEGYWRMAMGDQTGLIKLTVNETSASNLKRKEMLDFTIEGSYGGNYDELGDKVSLKRIKGFSGKIKNNNFILAAHKGGGRTSDRLPHSENTIEMINYSQYFGINAIEVDVQLTKDKIPVLYHDNDLNIRLVQKGPLYGAIQDFSYRQLRTLVKLIHGEEIPTLENTLNFIYQKTDIRFVWLDIKDVETLEYIKPIQEKYLQKAASEGRQLEILIGIPTEEVYNGITQLTGYKSIPTVSELEVEFTQNTGSMVWAYIWTKGIRKQDIINFHQKGVRTMVWTVDVPDVMAEYINYEMNDSLKRIDGILTNYPTILAYKYYVSRSQ